MTLIEFPPPANKNAVSPEPAAVAVNQPLVESLEALLERARTGDLTALIWAGLDIEWHTDTGYLVADVNQEPTLLGSVELLHDEYRRAIIE